VSVHDPTPLVSASLIAATIFETPQGRKLVEHDAVLLALGGASYPRLGSDAGWVDWLRDKAIDIAAFQPANCGFDVAWSAPFKERFAGAPLKAVMATSEAGTFPGEFVISQAGIEGSLVYTHAAVLRDRLAREGKAALVIDLAPGRMVERLSRDLARQDPKASFSNRLRKGTGSRALRPAFYVNLPLRPSFRSRKAWHA
jgi:predicted flavoprotein YhiN